MTPALIARLIRCRQASERFPNRSGSHPDGSGKDPDDSSKHPDVSGSHSGHRPGRVERAAGVHASERHVVGRHHLDAHKSVVQSSPAGVCFEVVTNDDAVRGFERRHRRAGVGDGGHVLARAVGLYRRQGQAAAARVSAIVLYGRLPFAKVGFGVCWDR